MPQLGLGLIGLVLVGSLWASLGFIGEWAGITAGLSEELAHRIFRGIGFGTTGLTCALSLWALYKNPSWRKQAAIGIGLYLLLLWLTPRSFTYDTGLYHLPVINHFKEIGLEWNLGWLHSRYAFFNLLLYGQAAIARLAGTIALPSLNGVVLTGLLLVLINEVRCDFRSLPSCMVATGALLLPSESTEGFHSYNADFSLGCIFLACCLLVIGRAANKRSAYYALGIAAFAPAIKMSGILLLPIIIYACTEKWGRINTIKLARKIAPLIAIISIAIGSFGYITSGYFSYPIAGSGPLRDQAISKEETIKESKNSTIAWARFAYSGQLEKLKPDATPMEWLPKWSRSLNGKRMLSYTSLSLLVTIGSFRLKRLRDWRPVLAGTTILWITSILLLPPDPRFYFGPILITLYSASIWLIRPDVFGILRPRQASAAIITSMILIVILTSIWRPSEHPRGSFPTAMGNLIRNEEIENYEPRGSRKIIKSTYSACWQLRAPCSP